MLGFTPSRLGPTPSEVGWEEPAEGRHSSAKAQTWRSISHLLPEFKAGFRKQRPGPHDNRRWLFEVSVDDEPRVAGSQDFFVAIAVSFWPRHHGLREDWEG